MKHGSTLFLRATIIALEALVLGLCAIVLPEIYREWNNAFPEIAFLRFQVLICLSITVIAFSIALYNVWQLLRYIDKNQAFSQSAVTALRNIKYCAYTIGGLYALALPLVYYIAEIDDAPGLILIGLGFTFAPIVFGVLAAVAERLFQNAIDIKSENDLTV